MTERRGVTRWSDRLALCWGTGLGSGYSPIAPGTAGSVVGILLYLLLHRLTLARPAFGEAGGLGLYLAATLLLFLAGVAAAGRMERLLGQKDPSLVVTDEVAGYLIAAAGLPPSLLVVGLTFVLFRFFDIIKPFPGRKAEGLPGGWGVMTDDLVAGIYANLLTRLLLWAGGLI